MRISYEASIERLEGSGSTTRSHQFARWVSDIISPPIIGLVGMLLISSSFETSNDWLWMLFYLGAAIIVPVFYVFWLEREGEISDFHMNDRHERIQPMLFMVACSMMAWAVLQMGSAPVILRYVSITGGLLLVFMLVITLFWKISGHSIAISAFGVFCVGFLGLIALPVLILVPIVVWSRIRLNYHTFGQTIAGLMTGVIFAIALLYKLAL
jgi:membrane-associated phospholipid phosphatase